MERLPLHREECKERPPYFPEETEKLGSLTVIGLTCEYGRSLYDTAWMEADREQTIIGINEMIELNEVILKETGGATSLASSGPTRDEAATALRKLYFPCQGAGCELFLMMNLLVPALVEEKKKDLCLACFNIHMNVNWSNKTSKHQVFRLRVAEKWLSPRPRT